MKKSLPHRFHALPILLAGLVVAHVVGSLQVYASNLRLFQTVSALAESGYLIVPNQLVVPFLEKAATALVSAVFFTLSIGAGAALLAFLATWTWKTACRQKLSLAVLPVLPFILLIAATNLKGLSFFPTLYLTLVPAAVALLTLRYTPERLSPAQWLRAGLHGAVVLTLAIVWAVQAGGGMFITIRDRLLLSNPAGIAVNDFYYRYTLYPAEAFKSLQQKMLKTCRLQGFTDEAQKRAVLRRLADYNYLAVGNPPTGPEAPASAAWKPASLAGPPIDLVLVAAGDRLLLQNKKQPAIDVQRDAFLKNTGSILKAFSETCDQNRFFRQVTFFSLLIGFPVVLYACLHFILARAAALFIRPQAAGTAAALLCLALGILAVLPVRGGLDRMVPADRIPDLLLGDKWQDKADALKSLALQGKDWHFTRDYLGLTANPKIPVRYWLARSLAVDRGPLAHTVLLTLMEDPQPIVACQAIYSLGRRKDARAVQTILEKISRSDHWYIQWYGYNALKGLGWRQKPSI